MTLFDFYFSLNSPFFAKQLHNVIKVYMLLSLDSFNEGSAHGPLSWNCKKPNKVLTYGPACDLVSLCEILGRHPYWPIGRQLTLSPWRCTTAEHVSKLQMLETQGKLSNAKQRVCLLRTNQMERCKHGCAVTKAGCVLPSSSQLWLLSCSSLGRTSPVTTWSGTERPLSM